MINYRRLIFITSILTALALSACAPVPKGSPRLLQQAKEMVPPSGKAGVYYFKSPFLAHAYLTLVTIDSQLFGYVGPGSYLYGTVPPGEHSLTAGDYYGQTPLSPPPQHLPKHVPRSPTIEFTAREGQNYFFSASLGFPGATIVEITDAEARGLMSDLTLSAYNRFEASPLPGVDDAPELHASAASANANRGCGKGSVICLTRTSKWHKENGKLTNVAWIKGKKKKDNFTFTLNEDNELMITRTDGEIIMLSGRVMLVKDVPVERGYEIDFVDAPMFNYLITTGLLSLAYPDGPSEVVNEHERLLSEKEKQLRFSTGSATFNIPAPWESSVRVVRVDSDTVSYESSVKFKDMDRALNMAGVWKNMNSRLVLENSMDIAAWRTYAVGVFTREPGRLDTTPDGKQPIAILDFGAYPKDFGVDTVGGLRAHVKKRKEMESN